LRVLTYLHSFEPGGLERDVLRFNGAWASIGIDAHIVLGRNEGALAGEAPDVPTHLLQTGRISTARFETLWMIWHLPRLIRQLQPNVIFCAGNSYTVVAVVVRALVGSACPPIVYRVSNDLARCDMHAPIRALYHLWLRWQAPTFAAIVAMADAARAEVRDFMKADLSRIVVINNGAITRAVADRLARARDEKVRSRAGRHWLGIGRLAPQKNFALLIDAFARIAERNDILTIVGDGSERGSIARQIAAHGLTDQIVLAGHQSPVDPWLADADAFVVASDFEGVPAVVIEALAAGIPIVATDCSPSMKALIGGVGRLVPPRDISALASAMGAIIEDHADPAPMRKRAEAFTIEENNQKWFDLFSSLAR
jgi:glycosyltransferase involved in cell wall biosynthesis